MTCDHIKNYARKIGRCSPARNRRIVNFSSHSTTPRPPEQNEPRSQADDGLPDLRITAGSPRKRRCP